MKYLSAIFLFFAINSLIFAEFQQLAISADATTQDNETTAKTAASFKSSDFQFNAAFELKPEQKLKTFGIKYSPAYFVNLYYGNLSFSNIYSRIKTPCFSAPGALSSVSAPSTGLTVSLPSSGTSEKTPEAFCIKLNFANVNFSYFERHKTAKTEQTEYFGGIDYHPARTRLHLGLFGGVFEAENEASTKWFLTTRPFQKQKLPYAAFETSYNGSYFKLLSTNCISSSPYERPTGSWRFCTTATSPHFRLDSGFFWCDADHITIEESLIRKTMAAYIHPQLKSITFKNGHKFRTGATFAVSRSFSSGVAPARTTRADFSIASEYRTKLLIFSFNMKCENALHGEPKNETSEDDVEDENDSPENKSHTLFKFMDKTSEGNFLYYTEKTANILGYGIKFTPQFHGLTQQLAFDIDYKIFPLKQTKNQITVNSSVSFSPNKIFNFSIKNTISLKDSQEIISDTNIYKLYSVKTECRAKCNIRYKNSNGNLTTKLTLKKEADSQDKLAIIFYCGATFYIKP